MKILIKPQTFTDPINRRLLGWTNSGDCKAIGEDKSCGPGLQLQVQDCIDGTNDKCLPLHRKQHISCSLPPCQGMYHYHGVKQHGTGLYHAW